MKKGVNKRNCRNSGRKNLEFKNYIPTLIIIASVLVLSILITTVNFNLNANAAKDLVQKFTLSDNSVVGYNGVAYSVYTIPSSHQYLILQESSKTFTTTISQSTILSIDNDDYEITSIEVSGERLNVVLNPYDSSDSSSSLLGENQLSVGWSSIISGIGTVLNYININVASDSKSILIILLFMAILFAGIYDILELVSLFDKKWVKITITIGIVGIAALSGVVNSFTLFMIQTAATFGTIGIVAELLIMVFIFFGLSIGNTWIAKWAAKRYGQREEIKAIKSSSEAKSAIRGLRELQEEFKRKQS